MSGTAGTKKKKPRTRTKQAASTSLPPHVAPTSSSSSSSSSNFDAEQLKMRGNYHMQREEYDAAITAYTSSVALHYDRSIQLQIASAHIAMSQYDQAVAACNTALLHDPTAFEVMWRRGSARFGGADVDGAIDDFESSLQRATAASSSSSSSAPPAMMLAMIRESLMHARKYKVVRDARHTTRTVHPHLDGSDDDDAPVEHKQSRKRDIDPIIYDDDYYDRTNGVDGYFGPTGSEDDEPSTPCSDVYDDNINGGRDNDLEYGDEDKENESYDLHHEARYDMAEGKAKDAIDKLTRAFELIPDVPILCDRAKAYLMIEDYSRAERDCDRVISKKPGYVRAWWRRGVARMSRDEYDGAIKDFQAALKRPSPSKLLTRRIESSLAQALECKILNDAIRAPTSATRRSSSSMDTKSSLAVDRMTQLKDDANSHYMMGQYAAALSLYTKSLELVPTDPIILTNRAMTYMQLDQLDKAEADCTRAIQIDSKNMKAWWRRGQARIGLHQYEIAINDLKHAIKFSPPVDIVREIKRNICAAQEQLYASRKASSSSSSSETKESMRPSIATSVWQLQLKDFGNASFKSGHYDDAVSYYTKSLALAADDTILLSNRAIAYIKLKQFALAETDSNRAIELDSNSMKAWWRRGIARIGLHQYESGISDLENALRLSPPAAAIKDINRAIFDARQQVYRSTISSTSSTASHVTAAINGAGAAFDAMDVEQKLSFCASPISGSGKLPSITPSSAPRSRYARAIKRSVTKFSTSIVSIELSSDLWRKRASAAVLNAFEVLYMYKDCGGEPNHVALYKSLALLRTIPKDIEKTRLVGQYHLLLADTYGGGIHASRLLELVIAKCECNIIRGVARVQQEIDHLRAKDTRPLLSRDERRNIRSVLMTPANPKLASTQVQEMWFARQMLRSKAIYSQMVCADKDPYAEPYFPVRMLSQMEVAVASRGDGGLQPPSSTSSSSAVTQASSPYHAPILIAAQFTAAMSHIFQGQLKGAPAAVRTAAATAVHDATAALKRLKSYMTEYKITTKFYGIQLLTQCIETWVHPTMRLPDALLTELHRMMIEISHRLELVAMSPIYRAQFTLRLLNVAGALSFKTRDQSVMYWITRSVLYHYAPMVQWAGNSHLLGRNLADRFGSPLSAMAHLYDGGMSKHRFMVHDLDHWRRCNDARSRCAHLELLILDSIRGMEQRLSRYLLMNHGKKYPEYGDDDTDARDARLLFFTVGIYMIEYPSLHMVVHGRPPTCTPGTTIWELQQRYNIILQGAQWDRDDVKRMLADPLQVEIDRESIINMWKGQGYCDICGVYCNGINQPSLTGEQISVMTREHVLSLPFTSHWALMSQKNKPKSYQWHHCNDCSSASICSVTCAVHHRRESCASYGNHINSYDTSRTFTGPFPNLSAILPPIWKSK